MSQVALEWVTVEMDVSCYIWTPRKRQRKNLTRVCGNINKSCHTRMSHGRYGRVMSHMIDSYIVMQQPSTHACRTWMSHGWREWVVSRTNATWMATQESHMCVAKCTSHVACGWVEVSINESCYVRTPREWWCKCNMTHSCVTWLIFITTHSCVTWLNFIATQECDSCVALIHVQHDRDSF